MSEDRTDDEAPVTPRVYYEQLAAFYRNNLLSIVANLLVGILLVTALDERLPYTAARIWLALMFLKFGLSALALRGYRRWALLHPGPYDDPTRWARFAVLNSAGAGLLWGAAALLLVPNDQFAQFIFMFVITGLMSGGVSAMSPYLPTLYAFLTPVLLAITASMITQGERWQVSAAALALVYLVMMVSFGRSINKTMTDSLRLRFQNLELLDDLRRQKNAAEAANVAKSHFLAAASHDLRQPLHALNLFVASLRARPLDGESRTLVGHIGASLTAMDGLFNGLLDISRLDAGVIQANREHFPVDALLERLRHEFLPQAAERSIDLRIHASDAVVHTDPALLERILRNLIANALRYTESGRVLVACRRGAPLRIQVWDSGIGIPAERQQDIFQEFVQLHNPERDRSKGVGLGLAIVKRLARLLELPLRLVSQPGRGSLFEVAVTPGDARQVKPPVAAAAIGGGARGGLVLVIDDESAIRDAMHTLLAQWGFSIESAATLAEMRTRLDECHVVPALIISDYRLRDGENGAEVVAQLQADFNEEIPAILITGDTGPDRIAEAETSGYALAHKPVQPERLRALIDSLLARP